MENVNCIKTTDGRLFEDADMAAEHQKALDVSRCLYCLWRGCGTSMAEAIRTQAVVWALKYHDDLMEIRKDPESYMRKNGIERGFESFTEDVGRDFLESCVDYL